MRLSRRSPHRSHFVPDSYQHFVLGGRLPRGMAIQKQASGRRRKTTRWTHRKAHSLREDRRHREEAIAAKEAREKAEREHRKYHEMHPCNVKGYERLSILATNELLQILRQSFGKEACSPFYRENKPQWRLNMTGAQAHELKRKHAEVRTGFD